MMDVTWVKHVVECWLDDVALWESRGYRVIGAYQPDCKTTRFVMGSPNFP